jgi:signal transduction histidine kinase
VEYSGQKGDGTPTALDPCSHARGPRGPRRPARRDFAGRARYHRLAGHRFEAFLFLFVFSWNVTVLPYWKSSKTLCLGSLLFLIGAFTDVHDEFFIQPYWVNLYVEDPAQALGAGLIGLGIWFWAREKEHLLDQLQQQRDFEASLIPKLSHDLRAPLTNLCGMNSVVDEDPTFLEDPKRRQEYHEVMWRGAKEMSLLIDNILESHRLKSGTVELKPSTVAMAPLLDEICKDFYYQTKTLLSKLRFRS